MNRDEIGQTVWVEFSTSTTEIQTICTFQQRGEWTQFPETKDHYHKTVASGCREGHIAAKFHIQQTKSPRFANTRSAGGGSDISNGFTLSSTACLRASTPLKCLTPLGLAFQMICRRSKFDRSGFEMEFRKRMPREFNPQEYRKRTTFNHLNNSC